MKNELTTTHPALVNYNPRSASLLEMRSDPASFPRIKSMNRDQVVYEMSKIVSQAFFYRGQAADPANIKFISAALVGELLDDTRYGLNRISLAEIQVVVKRAVLGGSDMFGISVASIYKVILEYAKGEGHLNQRKIDSRKRDIEGEQFRESPVSAKLQAATGNFIREHKKSK